MLELLERIETDAKERLVLPAGRTPAQELSRYKGFLKLETHRLKLKHRAGAAGLEICQARAAILDLLLGSLWTGTRASFSPQEQKAKPILAVVAIGGYGRAELNPHSDVDFMFLHERLIAAGRPLPHLARIIEGMLYPLWDIGLKVGHSVRTVDECVKLANTDMQSKTSLVEARLIVGDRKLFERFQKELVARCVKGHEQEYIETRIEDQAARRAKFGNSACMQEPNLKNGCGGLRDYQNLLWMSFFKYRTRSLKELKAHRLVTDAEREMLEEAYSFLLRVRTEMHYHVNRAMDVLSKNLQPAIAHNLGYTERSPSKRIEEFMRDVYTHSRNIYLITRTLEQRMALLPQPARAFSFRTLIPGTNRKSKPAKDALTVDGFRFVDGEIRAASDRVFRDEPRRLMRVFLQAQHRGLRLHPDLAQLIRSELGLVDRHFLSDEHVRDTFLTILSERGNVAPVLRAMHEVDFLGKYVPEFGRLTCLVQHEFYHQYTADEHTLMCVEQLDRVWEAKQPPYNAYTHLFQQVERPAVLYLALLLHDTGKPDSRGNHSKTSSGLARRLARRLALDKAAAETLDLVIQHHALLASTSQRRDLDDPAVIRNIARQVKNPATLGMLTLHTFADAQATSDKLWNGFKDSLLWSLHNHTMRLMTAGADIYSADEGHREQLLEEVAEAVADSTVFKGAEDAAEEIEAHWRNLPARYFQVNSAREVLRDLELGHRFLQRQIDDNEDPLAPVIEWDNDTDRACSAVKVCTWDRAGLFRKIAGSLSAAGLNILSAQIFSRADGIVLDTFFLNDARTGNFASKEQQASFSELIERALTGEDIDFHKLLASQKISRPAYHAYTGERIGTRINLDNDSSDSRTVVEVESEDRVGLLYTISQVLTDLTLDISTARICTERGAAIDSFYVREMDGGKVLSPQRQRLIVAKLKHEIQKLEEG